MQAFAAYLRDHHLEQLTEAYLARVRSLDVPLLAKFRDVPEAVLLEQTRVGLAKLLGELHDGTALAVAAEGLRQWEADELPGINRDEIELADLMRITAAQKSVLLEAVPRFTSDPAQMMATVLELEAFYGETLANALKLYSRLREEAVTRAERTEKEVLRENAQRILDLNDELNAQRQRAEQANRLKSEFLANMSHELRTPLNSILGYTELVLKAKNPPIDDRARTNLNVVKRNGKHLLTLINDVLDLAKVEAGRATVYVAPLDPTPFFQAIAATHAPQAREKGLALRVDVETGLAGIETDETKLRQIVMNLVSNALKFTERGEVRLGVAADGPDGWAIEVTDTGVGIAEDHLALVFEEFRQVDASSTRKAGGTGLGLTIARKLARLLGGDLTLKSEAGRGSTFRLALPRKAEGERPPEPLASRTVAAASTPVVLTAGGKLPVVTIDDDPEMLQLIAERLKDSPYVAVPASTGESGLALARDLKPYAITLDIILPNKDGWTVLRELKGQAATADIPVLILSVADHQVQGYALGAAGYLTKPVEQADLLAALDRLGGPVRAGDGYVLAIEDDPDARGLYRELFAAEGIRFAEATDGREGITAIERELPALVLLDLMMPNMDGFEVLAWLRERPETAGVPVVVVTARDLNDEDRGRLGRAQQVVCKGALGPDGLVTALRDLAREVAPEVAR